jgi:hypothetical protein
MFHLRNRDNLPVVAKLSHQSLRLEREYHIVQRLYRQSSAKDLLCRPLDKVTIADRGYSAFVYQDYRNNRLQKCQPTITNNNEYQQLIEDDNFVEPTSHMSLGTFLEFAIQCCDCLEMIHRNQSKNTS